MKKRRINGKGWYFPIRKDNKYTYMIKPVKDIQRIHGDLHEDK